MTLSYCPVSGLEVSFRRIACAALVFVCLSAGAHTAFAQDTAPPTRPGVGFELEPNYPNPFNPSTRIVFDIPKQTTVSLTIYNALGAQVAEVLENVAYQPGTHEISFNGANLATGVYFYRFRTPEFNSVKKMVLLK